jgi:hypothetical protein
LSCSLEIYSKIKEDPILVENWFDNEIIKIRMVTENNSSSIDNKSLINKIKINCYHLSKTKYPLSNGNSSIHPILVWTTMTTTDL